MLPLKDIEQWLKGEGVAAKIGRARTPDYPVKHLTLAPTGGFAATQDGAIARPTFQALSRGQSYDEAEELAQQVDLILLPPLHNPLEDPYPLLVGPEGRETRVLMAGRVGGDPAPVNVNQVSGHVTFSCNYWLIVER